MKRFEDLKDMLGYIGNKHRQLRAVTGKGVYGSLLSRNRDGSRIQFGLIQGLKIKNFDVYDDNTIVLEYFGAGYQFKGKQRQVMSARLFLADIQVVNVYDHSAEFFSKNSIDFTYMLQDYVAEMEALQQWVSQSPDLLRAQWLSKDDRVDQLLDEITVGRKIKMQVEVPRGLSFDYEEV